ncbi:MAG: histidine ammonia-lyase [Bacteroidetes bacterium]|nr:histidine ammonia-lyase [Bacteroidota bacterium]
MLVEHIQTIEQVRNFVRSGEKLELGENSIQAIEKSHAYILNKIKHDVVIYGINTGFGSLCNTVIPKEDLSQLQYNLLRSHACGTGEYVPKDIVKLMLLLKVKSLSYGYSGVQLTTVQRLVDFYNLNILPVVYQQGSLGASGDLAPLSHLCLPLLGEGEIWVDNQIVNAQTVLEKHNLTPIMLGPKEGLALINGTQFMSAYGIWAQIETEKILHHAARIAACSIDAFDARPEPFLPYTHNIRNQSGQKQAANEILELLSGSEINQSVKSQVQDPYSFRCIPQVHGASIDALKYVERIMTDELNAVTDNPNIFPDEDLVISGGNFHGQTLALSMDFAAMALAELANISERRIYKLIAGERGLPPFLAQNAGLESGLMIAQYTAAGIVSQNKQLCTPASVDSIVSSNGQEDHVSMGSNAATKLYKVVKNVQQVLAIEMLTASRAMHYRRPKKSSAQLESYMNAFEREVSVPAGEVYWSPILRQAADALFA